MSVDPNQLLTEKDKGKAIDIKKVDMVTFRKPHPLMPTRLVIENYMIIRTKLGRRIVLRETVHIDKKPDLAQP